MNKTVVVGMSGGVDSSVSAYLLKEQGYEVIGIFMRNWNDSSVTINNECAWIDDSNDALLVSESLGIPFQVVDLSEQYKKRIVDYMFAEYEKGRTPNPDILCNREIKFDLFMKIALELGADYVATGHYCQKTEFINENNEAVYNLVAGADKGKDQSYFLCQLNQQQLSRALFPIGHLQKSEVRKIATTQGLITAAKKDSQGLCFIGHVKLPVFLQQQLSPKEGLIVEIEDNFNFYQQRNTRAAQAVSIAEKAVILSERPDLQPNDGKTIGKHNGAHYYTVGQRKGLNVGGKEKPLFIIATNTLQNVVYVGMGEEHSGLNNQALFIKQENVHWLRTDLRLKVGEVANYEARIRYRQPLSTVILVQMEIGLYIYFEQIQKGIACGQFAAWYDNNQLIGSGVIE
jgi:tRNA-uridine 2-sulfurtransferase